MDNHRFAKGLGLEHCQEEDAIHWQTEKISNGAVSKKRGKLLINVIHMTSLRDQSGCVDFNPTRTQCTKVHWLLWSPHLPAKKCLVEKAEEERDNDDIDSAAEAEALPLQSVRCLLLIVIRPRKFSFGYSFQQCLNAWRSPLFRHEPDWELNKHSAYTFSKLASLKKLQCVRHWRPLAPFPHHAFP